MEYVLEINQLSKNYGKLQAVDKINFQVKKGAIYGLLGPNGSGKSTTLGMILNVVNASSGSWKWFGEEHSHQVLKKVGALIEHPNFYPNMTARQNLEVIAKIKGAAKEQIEKKLVWIGLGEAMDRKFKDFSLGMKQRLAIASALLNDPEVLILDEPTNGLDPQGIADIREIILKIAQTGTTIILASHLLDEVEKVCSHVIVLRQGKTLYQGSISQLVENEGFFVLKTKEIDKLKLSLQKEFNIFSKIEFEEGKIFAYLNQYYAVEDFHQELIDKGFILNHLTYEKHSLEQQFLELVKK